MAISNTARSFCKRIFRLLFGETPGLRLRRNGYRLEVVSGWGKLISYSRGVIGGQWAWRELNRPVIAPPPPQEWKQKIETANALCAKWSCWLKSS